MKLIIGMACLALCSGTQSATTRSATVLKPGEKMLDSHDEVEETEVLL
jgi:hypothetical protein